VLPIQVPLLAVKVWPSMAVPEIDGTVVFDGATACTPPVAVDDASAVLPSGSEMLLAVTWTTIVSPTSLLPSVYVEAVAPLMFEHDAPLLLQSCH